MTAEIRFGGAGPFVPVHSFKISAAEIVSGPEEEAWNGLPTVFAAEFKAMLHVWGDMGLRASFGRTDRLRYGGAADSRDKYELDLQDPPVAG